MKCSGLRCRCAVLLPFLCLLLCCIARADDRADLRVVLAQWRLAMIGPDPSATKALETPDFTFRGEGGKALNGAQLVAALRDADYGRQNANMDLLPDKFLIANPTATVYFTYYYSCSFIDKYGRLGPKGKRHGTSVTAKIRSTLVRRAGGWKFRSMQWLSGYTTLDRKRAGGARRAPL